MLTEQEKRDRETRRQRAARFGVQFEEDVAVARSAWNALKKQWTIADKKVGPCARNSPCWALFVTRQAFCFVCRACGLSSGNLPFMSARQSTCVYVCGFCVTLV